MKPVTPELLHPLTLAFERGLVEGHVSLGDALEFCNRCFEAYLEAVERNPLSTDAFVLRGIIPRNHSANEKARHTEV